MAQVEIIPLGGCGEIGKNMTVVRQGDEILVVDAGLSFPTEEMHGVDIVVPDFTYLTENAERVRGIVLTHGHEDHVGALPYLLEEVHAPVYGTELTIALLKRKLQERLRAEHLDLRVVSAGDRFGIGGFEVEMIHVTHSLADACAIAVHAEAGVLVFTGDFKFDFTPIDGRQSDMSRFAELGDEGVTVLLCDCTNVESPGWCPSERTVYAGFEKVFNEAPGRILITCFASSVHRIQQAFDVAKQFGRKVATAGRRMEQNISMAAAIGRLRIPDETLINLNECDKYSDEQLVILTTGTQGEPLAALSLMAKDEYPRMQIVPGDTVIYSAKPIPGNEAAVWQTVNRLFRQGARVVYGPDEGVHVSGHAYQEEIKLMINLTRPDYLAPVHGEPRHQHHLVSLARDMGYSDENIIVMENGNRLVIEADGAYLGEDVVCGRVLVDSGGFAGVSDEVLRDRRNLASDGVLFVNVAIDSDAGKVVGKPELVARGLPASDGELDRLREHIYDALAALSHAELRDTAAIHHDVSDLARKFLRKEINKRPLVVATVTDV